MEVWVAGLEGASSSYRMAEALSGKGFHSLIFSLSECVLDLEKNTVLWRGIDLSILDAIAVRKLGDPVDYLSHYRINLLHHLAFRGVRILSPPEAIETANNRYSNTLKLKQAGVPVPVTIIAESIDDVIYTVNRWGKVVLKPLFSSKGRGMLLLDSRTDVRPVLEQWQNEWHYPFYLQEFIRTKSDMGIAFLNGDFIGSFQRIAGNESWQTTVFSGGRYAPVSPPREVVDMAQKAADCFGLDYTVVDVVCNGGQYFVYEVSAFGGFSGLSVCNIDAADLLAAYIKKELVL
jgi:ribosomal protein S6--L-glutamate ligase